MNAYETDHGNLDLTKKLDNDFHKLLLKFPGIPAFNIAWWALNVKYFLSSFFLVQKRTGCTLCRNKFSISYSDLLSLNGVISKLASMSETYYCLWECIKQWFQPILNIISSEPNHYIWPAKLKVPLKYIFL